MSVQDRFLNTYLELNRYDFVTKRPIEHDLLFQYQVALLGGGAIIAARRAYQVQQELAVSYRDFNVGAAVVGYNPDNQIEAYLTGVNIKVDDTDLVNIHAEDIATGKAERLGIKVVPLLVVVGETQEDHKSGMTNTTLHPCGRCREMLSGNELIDRNTTIISSTPDMQNIEIYDLESVCEYHENNGGDGVQTVHLAQYPEQTPEEAQFIDTDWDIDWQTKVNPILRQRFFGVKEDLATVKS